MAQWYNRILRELEKQVLEEFDEISSKKLRLVRADGIGIFSQLSAGVQSKIDEILFDRGKLDQLDLLLNRHLRSAKREQEKLMSVTVSQVSPLGHLIDRFRRQHVSVVKSIGGNLHSQLTELLKGSANLRHEEIREKLRTEFGLSRNKAKVLARDQVLTLSAKTRQQLQTSAGIEEYVWTTSRDSRVRASHRELDGKVFRWDDPPDAGGGVRAHPGETVMCRCWPHPVVRINGRAV